MARLGVNVDHVATIREARKGVEPDPIKAASICEIGGCDSIVVHLREDRRHIKDDDVRILRDAVMTKLNLEMSIKKDIVAFACRVKPDLATLVPEKRQELTTEGGLNVAGNVKRMQDVVARLHDAGVKVSLFVNPSLRQIDASKRIDADFIEIHTGEYANAQHQKETERQLRKISDCAKHASNIGLRVSAGHGLDYQNVKSIVNNIQIEELNIGHSIIARAVIIGLERAVKEMLALIR